MSKQHRLQEKREAIEAEAWDTLVKELSAPEDAKEKESETEPAETDTRSNAHIKKMIKQAFSLREDSADYETIIERLDAGGRVTGTNLSVLFFAILIASIGLNMNSTAVIIGAMLISPLMGSIQLMGLGIATVDAKKFNKAIVGFAFQVLTAIVTSTLYFWITPVKAATSELLGRTSPTVWDILIATAGGLAGVIALTRKDSYNNVIPGVAIATALMPPLCTCGYALANGHWNMLGGAALLFTINTMFILVAAVTVLIILEVPEAASATPELRHRMRKLLIRNATLVLVGTILLTTYVSLRNDSFTDADANPVTPESVSTVTITNEMNVLFPEVSDVQIGQLEDVGEDGKLQKNNVVLVTLGEELTKERRDILEKWIDAAYDEDYTIIYKTEGTAQK